MTKNSETNSTYSCEYCKRRFVKESTMAKHICEYKTRMLEIEKPVSRIAYTLWGRMFVRMYPYSKKSHTKIDFVRSAYYNSFMKYSSYCIDVGVLDYERYTDWLLKNRVPVDDWCSDSKYTAFLLDYLHSENPIDAVTRSMQTAEDLAKQESIQTRDYLRYGNKNKICYNITTGKISPWMMYHCSSGKQFLQNTDEYSTKIIIDYIDPVRWEKKFSTDIESVRQVKKLLDKAGF